MNIQSSTIYDNYKVEITQMSINWQIGEQIVAYPHSREYGVTS